jgi:hypothetical protein
VYAGYCKIEQISDTKKERRKGIKKNKSQGTPTFLAP